MNFIHRLDQTFNIPSSICLLFVRLGTTADDEPSKYQKAGKISNEDMIYTLALFALEPARWIKRYEWRELTDLEYCSL